jgi:DedD protein
MAFFKFRFPGQKDHDHTDSATQSMESLRKRVKHRLMGSAVLVVLAVVGFPLVFDTQPRPLPLDMAIEVPDKAKISPATPPQALRGEGVEKTKTDAQSLNSSVHNTPTHSASTNPSTPVTSDTSNPSPSTPSPSSAPAGEGHPKGQALGATEGLSPKEVIVSSAASAPAPHNTSPAASSHSPSNATSGASSSAQASGPVTQSGAKNDSNGLNSSKVESHKLATTSKESSKESSKEGSKEGSKEVSKDSAKDPNKTSTDASSRFIVQVGAFTDEAKLKEVREKLEKAGMHTYTSPVVVKEVKTTRVRLGPFASKDEANKWATKVKGLNLQANVIKLP